jgi:hypothetical protein
MASSFTMANRSSFARLIAIGALALAACSSSGRIGDTSPLPDAGSVSADGDARSSSPPAGDAAATADASCPSAEPSDASSPLTITVKNAGNAAFELDFGCGGAFPVTLIGDSASRGGLRSAGVDPCGFDCSLALSGETQLSLGCSDCGPDLVQTIAPGKTTTISWNRRLYHEVTLPTECTRLESPYPCALGEDPGSAPLQAALSLCYVDDPTTSCSKTSTIPFTLDPTQSSIEVDVP